MGGSSTYSLIILVPLIGTNGAKRKNSLCIFLQAVGTLHTLMHMHMHPPPTHIFYFVYVVNNFSRHEFLHVCTVNLKAVRQL
jgi:hypothetical protein